MLLNTRFPLLYMARQIKWEVLFVLLIGFLANNIIYLLRNILPPMPLTIPVFIGTAISVIISFNLNQSYERWWEARKIWGSIVNDSRTLVLQLQSFAIAGNDEEIKKITLRQIAWCFSLGQTLRGTNPLTNLKKYISENELEYVSTHDNKPLALLQLHARQIAALYQRHQINDFQLVQLNTTTTNLTNSMGMAERIKTTVFPVTYKFFLHLIIYFFVIIMSIGLYSIKVYFSVPLLVLISSSFFFLEKTATQLQDPFSNKPTDTPVTAIAITIETNLKQLIGDTAFIPEPAKAKQFYIS